MSRKVAKVKRHVLPRGIEDFIDDSKSYPPLKLKFSKKRKTTEMKLQKSTTIASTVPTREIVEYDVTVENLDKSVLHKANDAIVNENNAKEEYFSTEKESNAVAGLTQKVRHHILPKIINHSVHGIIHTNKSGLGISIGSTMVDLNRTELISSTGKKMVSSKEIGLESSKGIGLVNSKEIGLVTLTGTGLLSSKQEEFTSSKKRKLITSNVSELEALEGTDLGPLKDNEFGTLNIIDHDEDEKDYLNDNEISSSELNAINNGVNVDENRLAKEIVEAGEIKHTEEPFNIISEYNEHTFSASIAHIERTTENVFSESYGINENSVNQHDYQFTELIADVELQQTTETSLLSNVETTVFSNVEISIPNNLGQNHPIETNLGYDKQLENGFATENLNNFGIENQVGTNVGIENQNGNSFDTYNQIGITFGNETQFKPKEKPIESPDKQFLNNFNNFEIPTTYLGIFVPPIEVGYNIPEEQNLGITFSTNFPVILPVLPEYPIFSTENVESNGATLNQTTYRQLHNDELVTSEIKYSIHTTNTSGETLLQFSTQTSKEKTHLFTDFQEPKEIHNKKMYPEIAVTTTSKHGDKENTLTSQSQIEGQATQLIGKKATIEAKESIESQDITAQKLIDADIEDKNMSTVEVEEVEQTSLQNVDYGKHNEEFQTEYEETVLESVKESTHEEVDFNHGPKQEFESEPVAKIIQSNIENTWQHATIKDDAVHVTEPKKHVHQDENKLSVEYSEMGEHHETEVKENEKSQEHHNTNENEESKEQQNTKENETTKEQYKTNVSFRKDTFYTETSKDYAPYLHDSSTKEEELGHFLKISHHPLTDVSELKITELESETKTQILESALYSNKNVHSKIETEQQETGLAEVEYNHSEKKFTLEAHDTAEISTTLAEETSKLISESSLHEKQNNTSEHEETHGNVHTVNMAMKDVQTDQNESEHFKHGQPTATTTEEHEEVLDVDNQSMNKPTPLSFEEDVTNSIDQHEIETTPGTDISHTAKEDKIRIDIISKESIEKAHNEKFTEMKEQKEVGTDFEASIKHSTGLHVKECSQVSEHYQTVETQDEQITKAENNEPQEESETSVLDIVTNIIESQTKAIMGIPKIETFTGEIFGTEETSNTEKPSSPEDISMEDETSETAQTEQLQESEIVHPQQANGKANYETSKTHTNGYGSKTENIKQQQFQEIQSEELASTTGGNEETFNMTYYPVHKSNSKTNIKIKQITVLEEQATIGQAEFTVSRKEVYGKHFNEGEEEGKVYEQHTEKTYHVGLSSYTNTPKALSTKIKHIIGCTSNNKIENSIIEVLHSGSKQVQHENMFETVHEEHTTKLTESENSPESENVLSRENESEPKHSSESENSSEPKNSFQTEHFSEIKNSLNLKNSSQHTNVEKAGLKHKIVHTEFSNHQQYANHEEHSIKENATEIYFKYEHMGRTYKEYTESAHELLQKDFTARERNKTIQNASEERSTQDDNVKNYGKWNLENEEPVQNTMEQTFQGNKKITTERKIIEEKPSDHTNENGRLEVTKYIEVNKFTELGEENTGTKPEVTLTSDGQEHATLEGNIKESSTQTNYIKKTQTQKGQTQKSQFHNEHTQTENEQSAVCTTKEHGDIIHDYFKLITKANEFKSFTDNEHANEVNEDFTSTEVETEFMHSTKRKGFATSFEHIEIEDHAKEEYMDDKHSTGRNELERTVEHVEDTSIDVSVHEKQGNFPEMHEENPTLIDEERKHNEHKAIFSNYETMEPEEHTSTTQEEVNNNKESNETINNQHTTKKEEQTETLGIEDTEQLHNKQEIESTNYEIKNHTAKKHKEITVKTQGHKTLQEENEKLQSNYEGKSIEHENQQQYSEEFEESSISTQIEGEKELENVHHGHEKVHKQLYLDNEDHKIEEHTSKEHKGTYLQGDETYEWEQQMKHENVAEELNYTTVQEGEYDRIKSAHEEKSIKPEVEQHTSEEHDETQISTQIVELQNIEENMHRDHEQVSKPLETEERTTEEPKGAHSQKYKTNNEWESIEKNEHGGTHLNLQEEEHQTSYEKDYGKIETKQDNKGIMHGTKHIIYNQKKIQNKIEEHTELEQKDTHEYHKNIHTQYTLVSKHHKPKGHTTEKQEGSPVPAQKHKGMYKLENTEDQEGEHLDNTENNLQKKHEQIYTRHAIHENHKIDQSTVKYVGTHTYLKGYYLTEFEYALKNSKVIEHSTNKFDDIHVPKYFHTRSKQSEIVEHITAENKIKQFTTKRYKETNVHINENKEYAPKDNTENTYSSKEKIENEFDLNTTTESIICEICDDTKTQESNILNPPTSSAMEQLISNEENLTSDAEYFKKGSITKNGPEQLEGFATGTHQQDSSTFIKYHNIIHEEQPTESKGNKGSQVEEITSPNTEILKSKEISNEDSSVNEAISRIQTEHYHTQGFHYTRKHEHDTLKSVTENTKEFKNNGTTEYIDGKENIEMNKNHKGTNNNDEVQNKSFQIGELHIFELNTKTNEHRIEHLETTSSLHYRTEVNATTEVHKKTSSNESHGIQEEINFKIEYKSHDKRITENKETSIQVMYNKGQPESLKSKTEFTNENKLTLETTTKHTTEGAQEIKGHTTYVGLEKNIETEASLPQQYLNGHKHEAFANEDMANFNVSETNQKLYMNKYDETEHILTTKRENPSEQEKIIYRTEKEYEDQTTTEWKYVIGKYEVTNAFAVHAKENKDHMNTNDDHRKDKIMDNTKAHKKLSKEHQEQTKNFEEQSKEEVITEHKNTNEVVLHTTDHEQLTREHEEYINKHGKPTIEHEEHTEEQTTEDEDFTNEHEKHLKEYEEHTKKYEKYIKEHKEHSKEIKEHTQDKVNKNHEEHMKEYEEHSTEHERHDEYSQEERNKDHEEHFKEHEESMTGHERHTKEHEEQTTEHEEQTTEHEEQTTEHEEQTTEHKQHSTVHEGHPNKKGIKVHEEPATEHSNQNEQHTLESEKHSKEGGIKDHDKHIEEHEDQTKEYEENTKKDEEYSKEYEEHKKEHEERTTQHGEHTIELKELTKEHKKYTKQYKQHSKEEGIKDHKKHTTEQEEHTEEHTKKNEEYPRGYEEQTKQHDEHTTEHEEHTETQEKHTEEHEKDYKEHEEHSRQYEGHENKETVQVNEETEGNSKQETKETVTTETKENVTTETEKIPAEKIKQTDYSVGEEYTYTKHRTIFDKEEEFITESAVKSSYVGNITKQFEEFETIGDTKEIKYQQDLEEDTSGQYSTLEQNVVGHYKEEKEKEFGFELNEHTIEGKEHIILAMEHTSEEIVHIIKATGYAIKGNQHYEEDQEHTVIENVHTVKKTELAKENSGYLSQGFSTKFEEGKVSNAGIEETIRDIEEKAKEFTSEPNVHILTLEKEESITVHEIPTTEANERSAEERTIEEHSEEEKEHTIEEKENPTEGTEHTKEEIEYLPEKHSTNFEESYAGSETHSEEVEAEYATTLEQYETKKKHINDKYFTKLEEEIFFTTMVEQVTSNENEVDTTLEMTDGHYHTIKAEPASSRAAPTLGIEQTINKEEVEEASQHTLTIEETFESEMKQTEHSTDFYKIIHGQHITHMQELQNHTKLEEMSKLEKEETSHLEEYTNKNTSENEFKTEGNRYDGTEGYVNEETQAHEGHAQLLTRAGEKANRLQKEEMDGYTNIETEYFTTTENTLCKTCNDTRNITENKKTHTTKTLEEHKEYKYDKNQSTIFHGTTVVSSTETTTMKPIFLSLPVIYPNSSEIVESFEKYYSVQTTPVSIVDDEKTDVTLNKQELILKEVDDFNQITEFLALNIGTIENVIAETSEHVNTTDNVNTGASLNVPLRLVEHEIVETGLQLESTERNILKIETLEGIKLEADSFQSIISYETEKDTEIVTTNGDLFQNIITSEKNTLTEVTKQIVPSEIIPSQSRASESITAESVVPESVTSENEILEHENINVENTTNYEIEEFSRRKEVNEELTHPNIFKPEIIKSQHILKGETNKGTQRTEYTSEPYELIGTEISGETEERTLLSFEYSPEIIITSVSLPQNEETLQGSESFAPTEESTNIFFNDFLANRTKGEPLETEEREWSSSTTKVSDKIEEITSMVNRPTIQYHFGHRKNSCNKTKIAPHNNCFCSVDSLVKDLLNLTSQVAFDNQFKNYSCPYELQILPDIVIGNLSTPFLRRKRSAEKREIVKSCDINNVFKEDFDLLNTEELTYAMSGTKVIIPCHDKDNKPENKVSWTSSNGPLTEGKFQETEGSLIIENIVPQDGATYTCHDGSIDVNHEVFIVALPKYTVSANVIYNISVNCSKEDTDILALYLPNIAEDLICGKNTKICTVDVKNPFCIKNDKNHLLGISLRINVVPLQSIMPTFNQSFCDLNCQMKAYTMIVGTIVKNTETFETLSVYYRLVYKNTKLAPTVTSNNNNVTNVIHSESPKLVISCVPGFGLKNDVHICAACPKNTFSNGQVSYCQPCPLGQYQPVPGSKSCLVCSSPLQDPQCLKAIYSGEHFKLLFGIVCLVILLLFSCIYCCRAGDKRRKNTKPELAYRRRQNRRRDCDIERQEIQPLINRKDRRRSKTIPPELPPPDF